MIKRGIWLIPICLLFVFQPAAAQVEDESPLEGMWVDLSVGEPLLEVFNRRALEDDIARVEHISQIEMLDGITFGKKLVVFKSATDAIRLIPHISEQIDIVGYNLEHGPANPLDEQEDPEAAIRELREVIDQYGLELAVGPDHNFAESHGAVLAPYADYFILQIQRVQEEPETAYNFVLPIVDEIKRANPDLQVSVQIRTEGEIDDLLTLLEPLEGTIEGISILTSVETVPFAMDLFKELRPDVNPIAPPAPVAKNAPSVELDDVEPVAEVEPVDLQFDAAAESQPVVADTTELPILQAEGEVSIPEINQQTGFTWVLVLLAVGIGFALGAGYISYRSGT